MITVEGERGKGEVQSLLKFYFPILEVKVREYYTIKLSVTVTKLKYIYTYVYMSYICMEVYVYIYVHRYV